MDPPVKKDACPSKLNHTKPSKKLTRISQRHQEKVAEWHLKKAQEKVATQSSYENSVTMQTSVESVNECKCIYGCIWGAKSILPS